MINKHSAGVATGSGGQSQSGEDPQGHVFSDRSEPDRGHEELSSKSSEAAFGWRGLRGREISSIVGVNARTQQI